MDISISEATKNDCAAIGSLHRQSIQAGFLSSLGEDVLRIVYEAVVEYRGSTLLVARNDERIVGFVAGTYDTRSFFYYVAGRKMIALIRYLLPVLFTGPVFKKILETRRAACEQSGESVPRAELISIAIDEQYQHRGIGRNLFKYFVKQFVNELHPGFHITVGATLTNACTFYERMGCTPLVKRTIHEGEQSIVYGYKS